MARLVEWGGLCRLTVLLKASEEDYVSSGWSGSLERKMVKVSVHTCRLGCENRFLEEGLPRAVPDGTIANGDGVAFVEIWRALRCLRPFVPLASRNMGRHGGRPSRTYFASKGALPF